MKILSKNKVLPIIWKYLDIKILKIQSPSRK